MHSEITRRQMLGSAAVALGAGVTLGAEPKYQLASFSAEVTVPLGHALMGGGITPAQKIEDPLYVHGFTLLGGDKPVVLAVVDWCEIRNDSYDRWRGAIAEAAGTTPERVMLSSGHQHDTPVTDLEAQRLLEKHKAKGSVCDLDFHEKTVQRVARAVRDSLKSPRAITHFGTGQAQVSEVASNRRYIEADGKPRFGRTSATRDPKVRAHPEGTVDPWLKVLSFWDGDQPVASIACYAVHPMSSYGKGGVSSDFVGMARKRWQADDPKMLCIYASGCSGNVTAGKYNDGAPDNRPVLADRIYQGMNAAWKATKRQPLTTLGFRSVPLRLEARNDAGFTVDDLTKRLTTDPKPFGQCLAALGLSWRQRVEAGRAMDLPVLDLGSALYVVLPGESYVEFQLAAQKLRPEAFVVVAGYGECGTGYVPIERAFEENDTNLHDWCWVAPGSEKKLMAALEAALKRS